MGGLTWPIKLISLPLIPILIRLRHITFQEFALALVARQLIQIVVVDRVLCVGGVGEC